MKQILKYLFYNITCPLLLFLRVDRLLQSRATHRRLIIMYHGVSARKDFSINGRHLPAPEFERHLQYFKRNFDILSLKEICDNKSTSTTNRKAIALTFDDGYLNNIENALPLLQKYKIPATFFVSTVSLDDPDYIHPSDYIDLVRRSARENVTIDGVTFSHQNNQLVSSGKNAYEYINSLKFQEFRNVFTKLREQYPVQSITKKTDPSLFRLVSNTTISQFFNSELFSVGSHSHDHVNLANLSRDEMKDQLERSKKLLEQSAGRAVDVVAFPYGYFNEEVVGQSSRAGYKYLIGGGSVEPRFAGRVFPRIGILNMAGYSFNMLSISRGFGRFGF